MPIEEIPKRGPELIVRHPVKKGSYALINYTNGKGRRTCRATVHTGSSAARVLSFTPDLAYLAKLEPEIVQQYEAERDALLAKTRLFLDPTTYDASTREAAAKTLEEVELAAPWLSSIVQGLVFSMNAPLHLSTPHYTLGRVISWKIFNA